MPLDRGQVVREVVTLRLPGLRGDVADEDTDCVRGADRLGDLRHEQAREDARIQAAGPDDDEIGLADGLGCVVTRDDVVGREPHSIDAGRLCDRRLAHHLGTVDQVGVQRHRARSRRDDLAPDGQNAVHLPYAFFEVTALNRRHRR